MALLILGLPVAALICRFALAGEVGPPAGPVAAVPPQPAVAPGVTTAKVVD